MYSVVRIWFGCLLIRAGMAIIPPNVRAMVRGILLYHVPGALTLTEKAEIQSAAKANKD